jgi:hypothetical protein
MEAVDYPAPRELDKAPVRQLPSGRWIAEHQHRWIASPTSTGKIFVACALSHQRGDMRSAIGSFTTRTVLC